MTVGATGRGGVDNMCFLTIKESNRDYDGDWECEVFLVIASLVGWFLTIKQSNQDNDAGFVCISGSLLGHWLQLHEECPEDFSMFELMAH